MTHRYGCVEVTNRSLLVGPVIIGKNSPYTLPTSDGLPGQTIITNGTGELVWGNALVTQDHVFTIITTSVLVEQEDDVSIGCFPWTHSRYSSYVDGGVDIYVDHNGVDFNITISTNVGEILGMYTIVSGGVHQLDIVNPTQDSIIIISVEKVGSGTQSPTIKCATLYFTSTTVVVNTIESNSQLLAISNNLDTLTARFNSLVN